MTRSAVGRALATIAALIAAAMVSGTSPHVASAIVAQPASRTSQDTFAHARHTKLACLTCHGSGEQHGRLTFVRPVGCQSCHHQQQSPPRCASCHRADSYGTARGATITVTVPGRQPKPRQVQFLHSRHVSRACAECHTTPVTLAPAPTVASCQGCHSDHHAPNRNCASCHRIEAPRIEHKPDVAHERCDACHTRAIVAELTPMRSFCSACHENKAAMHYVGKECSTCHFLATPEAYRARLVRPPA